MNMKDHVTILDVSFFRRFASHCQVFGHDVIVVVVPHVPLVPRRPRRLRTILEKPLHQGRFSQL